MTTKIIERTEYVECNWCGETDIEYSPLNQQKVEVVTKIEFDVLSHGRSWGDGESWKINDLCISCGAKLKKVLIAMGITVVSEECDW